VAGGFTFNCAEASNSGARIVVLLTHPLTHTRSTWEHHYALLCRRYNDYIQDKAHKHMNSTKWETLTDFVKDLGAEGFCIVDPTPKGWYIQCVHHMVQLARLLALVVLTALRWKIP
jgi:hypothetical protein